MVKKDFSHVREWVFDLDNTLYPPETDLFSQIGQLMTDYVRDLLGISAEAANHLRDKYWAEHGTTLSGLIQHHEVDSDHYLAHVHDIDLSQVAPNPELRDLISALPGRKIIFTNASTGHAERVTRALGIECAFDQICSIEHTGLVPKPHAAAYDAIFAHAGISPQNAAMFEDDPRNLSVPHAQGMRTVHVASQPHKAAHIHHHTDDLREFLSRIV